MENYVLFAISVFLTALSSCMNEGLIFMVWSDVLSFHYMINDMGKDL